YQYAFSNVPTAIKAGLDKLYLYITELRKDLYHLANGKMDDAIWKHFIELYNINEVPEYIMPMTISWLGISSVATVPTLLDMIIRDTMDDHQLESGVIIVLASVGAGMNINNVVYKLP